jgi:putative copper export protein
VDLPATDLLLLVMRWLHAMAAVVWVGAICFELFVVLPAWPAAEGGPPDIILARFDATMREVVQTALIVFLVSGAILTFERLSREAADTTYVLTLGLKVVLSVVMFQVGFRFRGARTERRVRGLRILAVLGLVIIFLATVLKWLYERALLPA